MKNIMEVVSSARSLEKPTALDIINNITTNFYEFSGDRNSSDDKALVGGVAKLLDMPITVIGIQKGKDLDDSIYRNFGQVSPEGYRKALRLMKQAEKFNRPILCIVNTSGAFCGVSAEEKGQGEAIARNLFEMSNLKVPILSIIVGEGGSGGALALAVADEVWIFEKAIYSILSPEGFATILWKDSKRSEEAGKLMKLTPQDLLSLEIVEKIINESPLSFEDLHEDIYKKFTELKDLSKDDNTSLLLKRYNRFRKFGEFEE